MSRRRFLGLWFLCAGLYLLLAAAGPDGVGAGLRWPQTNQHLLQVRAWRGEDIEVPDGAGGTRLELAPRLDVTPYIRHRVVADPREDKIIANLACVVSWPDPGGGSIPLQQAWAAAPEEQQQLLERATCYVGFPPGPSFLMLPLRTLLGGALAVQWLAAVLGGLAVAAADRLMAVWLDEHSDASTTPDQSQRLALLAGFGTLWLWLVPNAGTSLFAHTVAATGLTLALLAAWGRRWWWGGIAFALAVSSRPSTFLALPLLVAVLCHRQRRAGERAAPALVRAALPPLLAVVAMGVLNSLRFGSPLDFGYWAMITPPELLARMLEHGQLSTAFLADNLRTLLFEPPRLVRDGSGAVGFPYLVSDPRGMGVLFVTPAYAAMLLALGRRWLWRPMVLSAWISLVLVLVPGVLYFNAGWVQWGGRFLTDAWPVFLLLTALGLRQLPPWLGNLLVASSLVSNLWATLLSVSRVWPACCW